MDKSREAPFQQLKRVVKDLKPGDRHEIKRSDGQLFGTIGVPSGLDGDDLSGSSQGDGPKGSWFD